MQPAHGEIPVHPSSLLLVCKGDVSSCKQDMLSLSNTQGQSTVPDLDALPYDCQ